MGGPSGSQKFAFILLFLIIILLELPAFEAKLKTKRSGKIKNSGKIGKRTCPPAGNKVVCYFNSRAQYRAGNGAFGVGQIEPSICTHLIYAHAVLNADTMFIEPHDLEGDVNEGGYMRFNALREQNPSLITMISLGGLSDSNEGDKKYSILVQKPKNRAKFIQSVISFLNEHKFKGLDIDWEYPDGADKDGFTELVKELRSAFRPKGYLLSATVTGSTSRIDLGYDIPALSENLDWINVMSYDYHGTYENEANYHAALYPDVDDSINYLINKGADRSKLILGIPIYGISWKLADGARLTPPTPATGPGAGIYEAGYMLYWEICQSINTKGWTEVRDPKLETEAYVYNLPDWVSYDDPTIARAKGAYAKKKRLGGIMFFDLSGDDFANYCGQGIFPVILNAKEEFTGHQ